MRQKLADGPKRKLSADPGLDFENWICDVLPEQLNLSASKETAVKTKFGGFADYARQLAGKAPREFDIFFSELTRKFEEISKWGAPKGQKCVRGWGILDKYRQL